MMCISTSAGFIFARALGQAKIQGPQCQNQSPQASQQGSRGPLKGPDGVQGQGLWKL